MQDKYQHAMDLIHKSVCIDSFEKYILNSQTNKSELFSIIKQLKTDDFPRFNMWRLLLGVIPFTNDWTVIESTLTNKRKEFSRLKEQLKTGRKSSPSSTTSSPNVAKNPLMKGLLPKSEVKTTINQNDTINQIKVDIDRCYEQMQFFREKEIQELLFNILITWSRQNPDSYLPEMPYQQGMHEVLASIIFIYFQEVVILEDNNGQTTPVEGKYLFMNSIKNIQADIYSVFSKLMEVQLEMFKPNFNGTKKDLINPNTKINTPILLRISQILDQRLKSIDLELFRVLKLQNVITKTFVLKWIKCMHTRQFGVENSFFIWDQIFLDFYQSPVSKTKNQFQFIDAMCIAMFIYLRTIVLTRQTSNEIIQVYQKYPSLSKGQYLEELLNLAWNVVEELRSIEQNKNNTSNWYEDSGKVKNLGLMRKGGYAETVGKLEVEDKKKKNNQDKNNIVKQSEKIQRQSNAIFQVKQTRTKTTNIEPTLFKKQEVKIVTPKQKKQQIQEPTSTPDKKITFEYSEIAKAIKSLKSSIDLNDDLQSRALANKALKILEDRFK